MLALANSVCLLALSSELHEREKAQQSAAQHGTARHSTAGHDTARHLLLVQQSYVYRQSVRHCHC